MNKKALKDPFSAMSHLLGIILSMIGTIVLLQQSHNLTDKIGLGIFGASLICLYTASTIYHALDVSDKVNLILRKIDHAMIYVLIAGTYTPMCLIALKGAWGTALLITIWVIAAAGIALTLLWFDAPRWLTTTIYVLMGWLCVIATIPLKQSVGMAGLGWLLAGGLLYTIGAVIYATKRPHITFGMDGIHEIFHVFVLGGSLCHYILMLLYLPY
ncbi:MAG: rane protein, hemolysin III-like protein [Firmicutes bacterium]|nr:rane protein, hemolysin III-like protein [Bacillota bacterium]